MTITEVLSTFDDIERKSYDAHEILAALSSIDEDEKSKDEARYETLAFRLVPSPGENPWGFYFGPQWTFSDKDGNPVYDPDITEITPEAVLYWESRYRECKNPLLISRYAGLVWDFKPKVAHQGYAPDLYRTYVDSMLKVCNEDYCSHPVITVNTLERLFVIAKNQSADLQLAKDAYTAFEARHAHDDAVRCWASQFLIMIENRKCYSAEEIGALVNKHEQRLARMSSLENGKSLNPWNVESQAKILCQYYNSVQKKEDIKRILHIVEDSFQAPAMNLSALQLMGNLENVHQLYRFYGLEEEARRLSAVIQKIGEKAKEEMVPHSFEYEIPAEVQEQADSLFGVKAESNEVRWNNFAVYFIPRRDDEEVALQKLVNQYPFRFMMGTKMMDIKGRPMSYVGPYEEDPEGQLILHITQKLNIKTHFLYMAIQRLLNTGTLTVDEVMNRMVIPCPLFEEDRYIIIKEALGYLKDAKYTLFCHLIVPQIENALCNLVEMSGVTILKPQRNKKGFQLRTLDDLLREKVISDTFTEDGAFYLRLILTDQRAMNIRNLLCHGILPPSHFTSGAAAWLLHVFVMIGMVRNC